MKTSTVIYSAAFVVVVLLLQPILEVSASAADLSPEAIEGARTAADHTALADAYDKLAADARAEAAKHRRMQAAYRRATGRKHAGGTGGSMRFHCGQLVTRYEDTAAEAEMLADLHRQMATRAEEKKAEDK